MKKIAIAASVLILASCGTKTIVREVQVTPPPTTSTTVASVETMSTIEAIAWIRSQAPSFNYTSDASIYSLMGTACDTIDQWAPDYRGYLVNARDKLSGQNTEMRSQISAVIVGAISSICTQHKQAIVGIMNSDSSSGA